MFENIFKKKTETVKTDQPNMSRRNFLKSAGSALAVLMTAGIPKFVSAEEKVDYHREVMRLFSAEYFEFQKKHDKKCNLNTTEFEAVRCDFINHFSERAEFLFNSLKAEEVYLDVLYKRFSEYDAQGLLYQAMRKD
jgi:hypothetical protein